MARSVLVAVSFVLVAACGDDEGPGGSGGAPADGGGGSASTDGGAPTDGGGGAGQGGTTSDGGAGTGGGQQATCSGLTLGAGDTDFTMMWDGAERTYRVHAPTGYDPTTPAPLVLVLHGYTETVEQFQTITQMSPVADERGYIAVYPQGLSTSWNAGTCCGTSASQGVDDVGFILAMIDEISAGYCVDDKRVYSSGFSNGGMLSYRLACEHADRIAAIGPVSGTMAIDPCEPSRPVPVMHFHGTSDFIVPYDGGGLSGGESAPDTIAGWVERDGCETTPEITFQEGDATCETYSGCDAGAEVTLCTLEGGGHQWPGGESAGPAGEINMDIFASEALLTFFDGYTLP